jgi:uroporphyrinogen-III decarboxylase
MNSKEQLKKTLNHLQPDKIVVDFGSTAVTGIHVQVIAELRKYFGLENRPVRIIEPFQMLGEIDDELSEIMRIDVTDVKSKKNIFGTYNNAPFREWRTPWNQVVLIPESLKIQESEKGDFLIYPQGDPTVPPSARMPVSGYFFDAIIRQQPIVEEQLKPEDNLEEFSLLSEEDLSYWKKEIEDTSAKGKGIVVAMGGTALGDIALVPAMNLKNPKGIRDISEWYMSTLMRTDFIKKVFERQVEIAIENLARFYQVAGNKIDVIFICGTDFGTQSSTFCSPEHFKNLWLSYYKKINDWIHENTSWKTFKHSCGAVESFMQNFIDAGFDIINPVQINASGMVPALLKQKYGKKLVFWGGGIDTQKVLPFGTPEMVREQVLKHCRIFGKNGGFVFNTVHNIQANTPVENVIAMLDALKKFN